MATTKSKARSEPRVALVATRRDTVGSRAVRRMRREGFVPGIVYGKATTPTPIMMSRRELVKLLHARAGEHGLVTLRLEADLPAAPSGERSSAAQAGGKAKPWEKPVLIKHVEHDPVHGEILHVDLHAIALTEQIRIKIPIVLNGEPVGVKQEGGVLEHFLREIEVECLPTEIPKQVEHEISHLKIGDAIHVRDLTPPPGAKIMADSEGVIASVLAPREEKIEEAAEAITEPEVIREKKPEAEEGAEGAEGKGEKKAEKADKKEDKKEEKSREA